MASVSPYSMSVAGSCNLLQEERGVVGDTRGLLHVRG